MSLKSMPKSFDLTLRRVIIPISLTRPRIWIVGPYAEHKYYGQTLSGDERAQFLAWYEEQKENISKIRKLLAYSMDDISVLKQACCCFINLFFKLAKMDPFRNL